MTTGYSVPAKTVAKPKSGGVEMKGDQPLDFILPASMNEEESDVESDFGAEVLGVHQVELVE